MPIASAAGTVTLTVNSVADLAANPGACLPGPGGSATTNECTLAQAIRDGNNVDANTEVFIAVAKSLGRAYITYPSARNALANTAAVSGWDSDGAVYEIQRPMTVDLDNRLHLIPPDGGGAGPWGLEHSAALHVYAPDVHLLNFTDWFSYGSVIVFSSKADRSSLEGGSSIQSENWHTGRQIVVAHGADDVTISNYKMGRQYYEGGSPSTGGIMVGGSSADNSNPVNNLTIRRVVFDQATVSGAPCNATDGRGCQAHGINLVNAIVRGLTVERCEFKNIWKSGGAQPIDAYFVSDQSSDWDIKNNVFTDIRTGTAITEAVIQMPQNKALLGTSYIRGNTFDNSAKPAAQGHAIYWHSNATTGTSASGLFIEDNRFDGYRDTIVLIETGAVTVRRNTFGTNTSSMSTTINEETAYTTYDHAMLINYNSLSNGKINTWYPTNATNNGCSLEVTVSPRSGPSNPPATPLTVDVYWTEDITAEVYLGSFDNLTGATTLTLDRLQPAAGYIRLQTQGSNGTAQPLSSQFSQTFAIGPPRVCDPDISVDLRAWTNVPAEADSYEDIIQAGTDGEAVELDDASAVPADANIWFTYTVTNTGDVTLTGIKVYDRHTGPDDPVCDLPPIAPDEIVGCYRQHGPGT
jgi:hypothetical protein